MLIYFIAVGGTLFGELVGLLRIINTVLGAALVVAYVMRAPRMTDGVDRLILGSLLLFTVSALFSAFPRQSLDALLAATAYVALFYLARDAVRQPAISEMLIWTMRIASAGIAIIAAARYLPTYAEWWQLTNGTVLPPLGLPLDGRPWGHAYDMLSLGVMLLPSWLVGPPRKSRIAAAAIGAVLGLVILLLGSRAHWFALAIATATVLAVWAVGRGRPPTRRTVSIALSIAAVAVVAFVVLGGPLVERLFTGATIGQRVEMWSAGVEAWLQRPIGGFGPGTFPWILQTTDYFDTNSIHPRHPDSAIFQLLPEAGLLGVAAAALVLLAIGWPLIRTRRYLVLWPLTFFAVQGLAANPTDFSYLIVIAAFWAAIGLPRNAEVASEARMGGANLRPAFLAGIGIISIAVAATLVAGLQFDAAASDVRRDDIAGARQRLDAAVALDPSMALYARQRGVASLQLGDASTAVSDLQTAARLNPNDDLAWRSLAVAYAELGRAEEARKALGRSLSLQRDLSNLTLLAHWQAVDRDADALSETLSEIVLAWPTIVAAPGWTDLAGNNSTKQVVASSIERWEQGLPSPEPLREQVLLLALAGERPDLFADGARLAGLSEELVRATTAVAWCEPTAESLLNAVPSDDRRSAQYWALLVQHAAEHGQADPAALRLYEIDTSSSPSALSSRGRLNPLRENNERGSVDAWGYDRIFIRWESSPIMLPQPDAGAARWLLDPRGARRAIGIPDGLGSCSAR